MSTVKATICIKIDIEPFIEKYHHLEQLIEEKFGHVDQGQPSLTVGEGSFTLRFWSNSQTLHDITGSLDHIIDSVEKIDI